MPEFVLSLLPDEHKALTREVSDGLMMGLPEGPEALRVRMRLCAAGWRPYQPVRLKVIREDGRPLYPHLG